MSSSSSSSRNEPSPHVELPTPLYHSLFPHFDSYTLPRTSQLADELGFVTSSDSSSSNLSMASGRNQRGGRGRGGGGGNTRGRGTRGGRGGQGGRGGRGGHHDSALDNNTTPSDIPRLPGRPPPVGEPLLRPTFALPPTDRGSQPSQRAVAPPTNSGRPQPPQTAVVRPAAPILSSSKAKAQQRPAASQAVSTQRSYVDSNGSFIKETQTVRPHSSAEQVPRTAQKSIIAQDYQCWPYQTLKIKISGLPKMYWTEDVYLAMSAYGTVQNIEMEKASPYNNAYVIFQLPLSVDFQSITYLQIGDKFVSWKKMPVPLRLRTVRGALEPAERYCENNTIFANTLDFGMQKSSLSMVSMFTVQAKWKVQLTLNLVRKELDIRFPLKVNDETRNFRFRLPISIISHIYQVASAGQTNLIIPFDHIPQFYQQMVEGDQLLHGRKHASFSDNDMKWVDWNTWYRETDVVEGAYKERLQDLPVMNHKDAALIDIGRWTTYRLSFDDATLAKNQFNEFSTILADCGVLIEPIDQYFVKARSPSPVWKLLHDEISETHPHLNSHEDKPSLFTHLLADQVCLSFPVQYQLEACLSNGFLKEHNITRMFLEKLHGLDPSQAISLLEKVVNKKRVYHDPMEVFHMELSSRLRRRSMPNYCVLQRSVVITPTTMHVNVPVMETSNRITRQHSVDADRFIRVKFSDEKTEGPLRTMPNDRAEATFERVRRAMKNGIVVAGRYYEFLAFGNSQFRENGAYFYAPTSLRSADDIRSSLGNFDHIRSVAKFGARIGQAFSTTRAITTNVKIVNIKDVERNGHVFTDGVGRLSSFIASMAAQDLGLSNAFNDPPSLYQFRLGGYKGVLAIDPTLKGSEIHIRPSQQKFEADSTRLEIIRSSSLSTPFFNRQIIMVLSTLGVRDDIIIKKQQRMVDDYARAMFVEEVAIDRLQRHIDQNETTLTMAKMVLDGFMCDPFVTSLLKLWRAHAIKHLKERARIAIDDGAFVLGCVDETAILKGHFDHAQPPPSAARDEKLANLPEIFIQIDDTSIGKKGHYKVIKGICILARNPSLHPGDVRVVLAVDVPELHHHKNVVVFPQTGDRDLASMCSGGDLDGDDYMVLWDKDLIPEIINAEPMDFTPEKPPELDRPVSVADITEFFVTYMKNNTLGQIAHAHLGQADYLGGVGHEICLKLAKLHSQAVDYNKSGIPAVLTRDLRPCKWPHFMEKKYVSDDKIYKSGKILGQLYDRVELVGFAAQYENPFDKRVLQAYDLDAEMLQKAAEIKLLYDESLRRLMAKHGIETEFEAWSVFVLEHNHETNKYKFVEDFGRTIGALKTHFRKMCRAEAGAGVGERVDFGPFAAAMYMVTAKEVEAALEECRTVTVVDGQEQALREMTPAQMPLISFPWLFPDDLGRIAGASRRDTLTIQPYKRHSPSSQTKKTGTKLDAAAETVKAVVANMQPGEVFELGFGASDFTSATIVDWTPTTKGLASDELKMGAAPPTGSTSNPVINGTVPGTGITSGVVINNTATHVESTLGVETTAMLALDRTSKTGLQHVEVNGRMKEGDEGLNGKEQEKENLNVGMTAISEPAGFRSFETSQPQVEGVEAEKEKDLNVVINTPVMSILNRLLRSED